MDFCNIGLAFSERKLSIIIFLLVFRNFKKKNDVSVAYLHLLNVFPSISYVIVL